MWNESCKGQQVNDKGWLQGPKNGCTGDQRVTRIC